MRKWLPILLVLLILGCVEEREKTAISVAERNTVLDCQCHEEPWSYAKHYANVTSCKSCHGNEILMFHKNLSDWRWDEVSEISCTLCHDYSLLANHGGKCEVCHKSIYETHRAQAEKFVKR